MRLEILFASAYLSPELRGQALPGGGLWPARAQIPWGVGLRKVVGTAWELRNHAFSGAGCDGFLLTCLSKAAWAVPRGRSHFPESWVAAVAAPRLR